MSYSRFSAKREYLLFSLGIQFGTVLRRRRLQELKILHSKHHTEQIVHTHISSFSWTIYTEADHEILRRKFQ